MATTPRQKLRAVAEGEAAAPKRALTVTEAASTGETKKLLLALRERIAKTVDDPNCPPRELAALSRRLQDIVRDLEAIEARERQEAAEDGDSHPDETWDSEAL